MSAPSIITPPVAGGGGGVGGAGTISTIPLWLTPTTLTDSALSQSGAIVTNTGTFRAANGTFSEPAYTFSASSGTGMYRATSGALLRFAVSGAYAFGVDTNGNFGIGTASPATTLHVARNGTTDPAIIGSGTNSAVGNFESSDFGRANRWTFGRDNSLTGNFVVAYNGSTLTSTTSGGNVGIGITNPYEKFQVYGDLKVGVLASGSFVTLADEGSTAKNVGIYRAAGTTPLSLGGYGGITFHASANALGAQTERMRVSGTGVQAASQVAIGTSSFTSGRSLTTVADLDVFGVRVGRGAGDDANSVAVGPGALDVQTGGLRYNTAIGASALAANTTGQQNTAVGRSALAANTTALNSTAVGHAALASATGAQNTAVGSGASFNQTTGASNTSIGHQAGWSVTTTSNNVSVGQNSALYQTGSSNTAIGAQAMQGTLGSSTASNNVAVGAQAGQSVTTGANNVFVGYVAGSGVTTGTSNTMIGYATASGGTTTGTDNTLVGAIAGNQITTGSNNVCVGSNAGQTQNSANDNTYVGKNAGYFQTASTNTAVGRSALLGTTGSNGVGNAALGHSALQAVTTGSYNTSVGFNAGGSITSGASNISIGTDAGPAAGTDSNVLAIGSSLRWVATPTAATYYATAGASLGYIQIRLNGANVKIQVFAP